MMPPKPPPPPRPIKEEVRAETSQEDNKKAKAAAQKKFVTGLKNKKIEKVLEALEEGADIQAPVSYQYKDWDHWNDYVTKTKKFDSALSMAYSQGNLKIARCLVAHGFDVNYSEKPEQSCLVKAVNSAKQDWVRFLIGETRIDLSNPGHCAALEKAEGKKKKSESSKVIYHLLKQAFWECGEPWDKVNDHTIAHVHYDREGMIEVSDQFNFQSAERTRYVRDLELNALATESRFFTEMPANAQGRIKEAWDALLKRDGGKECKRWQQGHVRHYQRR